MFKKVKKMKKVKQIEKIVLFLIFFYEEFFVVPAKKILSFFKKILIYNKILDFFSKNFLLLIIFIVLIGFIAEINAFIGSFLILKKNFVLGIFFYSLKLLMLIPVIDLFKRNKKKILRIKVFKFLYFYYINFKHLPIFRKIRKMKRKIRKKMKIFLKRLEKKKKNR